MSNQDNLLTLTNLGHVLDHPEAVAWGPDGMIYAGGEDGQLYRICLGGQVLPAVVAKVAGGFLLGLAHDAAGNVYACDERKGCVHRITPAGDISTYAKGDAVAEFPIAELSGVRRCRQSLCLGLWRFRAMQRRHLARRARRRARQIWDRSANGFTNGMCLSADGRWLYVAESSPPLISRVAIKDDGSAGESEVVVHLPRTVPDGVALDIAGDLYISLYNPNIVYRFTRAGELITLYDDWEQLETDRAHQHRVRRRRHVDALHRQPVRLGHPYRADGGPRITRAVSENLNTDI